KDSLVPVAAHGPVRACSEVARGNVDSRQQWKSAEQPLLQRHDQVVVGVIALGTLNCRHAEEGDGPEGGVELGVEGRWLRPGEPDRPETGAVGAVERKRGR